MFYNGGGNNAYAVLYFNQVSIGSNISGYNLGVTQGVDDTWAVDVKYSVSAQGANYSGFTAAFHKVEVLHRVLTIVFTLVLVVQVLITELIQTRYLDGEQIQELLNRDNNVDCN